jgi:glycosyltransferase 2 family protein
MSKTPSLLKRLASLIPSGLGLALFGASAWTLHRELQQYSLGEVWRSLTAIPSNFLGLAVAFTLLNYLAFTGYDTLAVKYIRHPLPYRKTALTAIVSIAISNSIGLALLSSSAIRYRFYTAWGLSAAEIAHIIAFCNLGFWLGLFATGSIVFLIDPIAIPALLHLPFNSVQPIGYIFLAVTVGYLSFNLLQRRALRIGRFVFPHLSMPLALGQVGIAAVDWILAAAALYALLPPDVAISYPGFFGIYLLGQIAGVISNVPGGLGVFETVVFLLLSPLIPSAKIFGALIAYRGIYYLAPLLIAVMLLGLYELKQRWRKTRS